MPFVITPALIAIGVSSTAASVISGVASVVIGLGFQLLSSILFKPKQPKPSDGQITITQSAAPRFRSYGRVKVGGVLMFANTKAGRYHRVIAMGSGEIDAVEEHWIDDNEVTLVADEATSAPYVVDGASRVHIEYRLGDDSPAVYSYLAGQFSDLWTAEHLGKGIPSAHVALWQTKDEDFADTFPRAGDTQYRQVQRGAKVPDVSGGVITAASWSDNAARIILDYLTHSDGLRLNRSWIENAIDTWEEAIAVCNEVVNLKGGGTEKRYRLWNSYYFDERPADVSARFLQAADAVVYPTPNRGLAIKVGKWETPTVTIDDDAIVAFTEFGRGRDILTTANVIRARFTDPDNDYQENDAQPWIDAVDVAVRGEISADLEFYAVPSHSQCRRLMKIAAHRANPDWVGTLTCNLRALPAMGERFINVQISELDVTDTFEIITSQLIIEDTILTGIELQIQSISSAAYEWDEEIEEGSPPGEAQGIEPENTLLIPTSFSALNIGYHVVVAWDAPADDLIASEVRYRPTSETDWLSWPVENDAHSAAIGPLTDGVEYEFQVRHRSNLTGRASDWTSSEIVTVVADTTPPGAVVALSYDEDPVTNEVYLSWVSPNSPNFSRALVYRNTTNDFGTATIIATRWGGANLFQDYTDNTGGDGAFYYWVTAANGSGVEGVEETTGAVTV